MGGRCGRPTQPIRLGSNKRRRSTMAGKTAQGARSRKAQVQKAAGAATFEVLYATLGAAPKSIKVKRGGTVRDVLLGAGIPEGDLEANLKDVRLDGAEVQLGTKVQKGDFVTMLPRVQGGVA